MDEKEVKKLIKQELKTSFAQKRVGDTPTDALQLVNKKYVDSKSSGYPGHANTAGTSTFLPTGWSISGGVTGQSTITHNLGTSNYAVVASVLPQNTITIVNIDNAGNNSFLVKTLNQTGATSWSATNTDFFFILIPQ